MPGRDPTSLSGTIDDAVEVYEKKLIRYVTRILGNRNTAVEVVQECFARLQREVRAGTPPPNLKAWLYRVARNLSIGELRKLSRFESPDDPNWMLGLVARGDSGNDPAVLAQKEEEKNMVLESLDRLPPRQREAVRLKFQEGLTYAEIGQVTEQSIATVGWLLHEAIATLRKKLASVQ